MQRRADNLNVLTVMPSRQNRLPDILKAKAAGLSISGIVGLLVNDVGGKKVLHDAVS
jgi:preprotein translocase subunit Sss1